MFPAADSPWVCEGGVNLSGNDVLALVDHAEGMRQRGEVKDERYRLLLRVLDHFVEFSKERKAKLSSFTRRARTEVTSRGIFTPTQYKSLLLQVGRLKRELRKTSEVKTQLAHEELLPTILRAPADPDPCAQLTEMMEAQFPPKGIDSPVLEAEGRVQFDRRVAARVARVEAAAALYRKADEPVPLVLELERLRASQVVLKRQQELRDTVSGAISDQRVLKQEYRQAGVVESDRRRRNRQLSKANAKATRAKKRARKNFLSAVAAHVVKFNSHHRKVRASLKSLVRNVEKRISQQYKREAEREKSQKAERLKALRAKDEKKYMELVMQAKNGRLIELLRQTEDYMKRIGATIIAEQAAGRKLREQVAASEARDRAAKKAAAAGDAKVAPEEEGLNGDPSEGAAPATPPTSAMDAEDAEAPASPNSLDLAATRKSYYNIAHKQKELVRRQPKAIQFGKLRGYQMAGLQWLVSLYNNNLNGILADEMGLGKTIQTISLLAYIMEHKKDNGPFLIIAPMSTLHNNWTAEVHKWVPTIAQKTITYDGDKQQRKRIRDEQIARENYNILLTTFEFAMRDKKFLRKIKWRYIIVDEAHRLKNPKCKLVSDLREYDKAARRIALSGTPLQNDLAELWALLNFLHPSIFNSCDNFQQWFAGSLEQELGTDGQEVTMNEEEKLLVIDRLHSILRPFVLRREKKDVESQLQDKVDVVLRCRMTPVQRTLYEAIDKGHVSLHNRMVQLRKICNHPYLFHPHHTKQLYRYKCDERLVQLCSKFQLLDNILPKLKSRGHRVLLFNQMTKSMDIIEQYLTIRHYKYLRLDGTTSAQVRNSNTKLFNAKDSPYFLFMLSTKAGGLGLNLQSADTVILFDSDWNPQNDQQAQARAHRIGQRSKVISIRFVTIGTLEEKVLETAQRKRNKTSMVIEAGRYNQSYDAQKSKAMVRDVLRNKGESDEVWTDLDAINRLIARDDDEYKAYQEIDKNSSYTPPPEDKLPIWVWDFLLNGSKADDTRLELVTKEESREYVSKRLGRQEYTQILVSGPRSRKKVRRGNVATEKELDAALRSDSDDDEYSHSYSDRGRSSGKRKGARKRSRNARSPAVRPGRPANGGGAAGAAEEAKAAGPAAANLDQEPKSNGGAVKRPGDSLGTADNPSAAKRARVGALVG